MVIYGDAQSNLCSVLSYDILIKARFDIVWFRQGVKLLFTIGRRGESLRCVAYDIVADFNTFVADANAVALNNLRNLILSFVTE